MDSLKIETGIVRLQINDGPACIEFNPQDVNFVERYYGLLKMFYAKQAEYEARSKELAANTSLDEKGLPANFEESIAFAKEVCGFVRSQIDTVFGTGTSQKVFGDSYYMPAYGQFFTGLSPYIEPARAEKIAQFSNPPPETPARKRHKATMK